MKKLQDYLIKASKTKSGVYFIEGNGEDIFVSYSSLFNKATKYLHLLNRKGIKAGDELLFQLETSSDFIYIFWACIIGGIIPVPLMTGGSNEHKLKFAKVWNTLKNPYLITTSFLSNRFNLSTNIQEYSNILDSVKKNTILFDKLDIDFKDSNTEIDNSNDIAFIQFSSGSTGSPKGVVLTHENLITNINAIQKGTQITNKDSTFSWMPLTHDMGLIGFHLTPLFCGINQYIMPTSLFIRKPKLWIDKVSEYKTTLLSSPNFGYKFFLDHKDKGVITNNWDLSNVRLIFNGAEPIDANICEDFLAEMHKYGLKKNSIFCVYGLAEASLAVSFPPIGEEVKSLIVDRKTLNIGESVKLLDSTESGVKFVDLGYPVEDCFITIFNQHKEKVNDGVVGNVYIKGKNVTKEYYNNKKATIQSIDNNGWLNTGDLGFFNKGRLIVTGREKDIIFVNGQNYYSHDIERLLSEVNSLNKESIVVSGVYDQVQKSEKIVVFITYRKNYETFLSIIKDVKETLNKSLNLSNTVVIPIKRIPKTTSGKVQRFKLANNYLSGKYKNILLEIETLKVSLLKESVLKEPSSKTEVSLLEIWKDILKTKNCSVDDDFFKLGGDSLKGALLLGKIQEVFNVELDIQELFNNSTIEKIAHTITSSSTTEKIKIIPQSGNQFYPLSNVQKRMYLLHQKEPDNLNYNLPYFMIIKGDLDINRLKSCFNEIVNRHEILRTSFSIIDGEPVQIINNSLTVNFTYDNELSSNIHKDIKNFIRPFNLKKDSLIRIGVKPIDHQEFVLMFDMHHIVTDGTSIGIILREFTSLYSGLKLKPVELQYKDYTIWRIENNNSNSIHNSKDFWHREFLDQIPILDLPTDYKRPATSCFKGSRLLFSINSSIKDSIHNLADKTGTTPFMILLSVYYIFLSKYTGQEDIVVGSPIMGRPNSQLNNVLGMFVNSLPLRNYPKGTLTFEEFLLEVKTNSLLAFKNQNYPYESLVNELDIEFNPGRNPIFDTMFSFQNMEIDDIDINGLLFTPYLYDSGISKFDLTMTISENIDTYNVELEYKTSLFNGKTIKRMSIHYIKILETILANINTEISEIPLITEEEAIEICRDFNSTKSLFPKDKTLAELFEDQVLETPGRIALSFGNNQFTYNELNCRSNQLANILRKKGVCRGSVVGLLSSRSIDMVISILGILKASGSYLPIDSANPKERIEHMISDSNAMLIIAEDSLIDLVNSFNIEVIKQETILEESRHSISSNLQRESISSDCAYIMYTSGSTGKPKGILTTHCNISRVVKSTNYIDINENDVMLQLSNYAFDGSTFDFFGSLLNGAKLVLVPNELVLNMKGLAKLIVDEKISLFFITTALFNTIVDTNLNCFSSVRKILFGGERVSVNHVKSAFNLLGPNRLIHVYGPTESTVFTTFYPVNSIDETYETIPIGGPIANTNIYVVDRYMKLQPVGIAGELYISGDGLAQGYLNREDLTKEKFIYCSFTKDKLYRSGDLVKWLPDGSIEFLGRIDNQIKLRGFRLELNEIENSLLKINGLNAAFVTVIEKDSNNKILCAYCVCSKNYSYDDLKKKLLLELPIFMIPEYIIFVNKLPINSNGKINKKLLPGLEHALIDSTELEKPKGDTENLLYKIWVDVLGTENIGTNQKFSDIGGHSLKAATIISRIFKEFNKNITLNDFYTAQTIKKISIVLNNTPRENRIKIDKVDQRDFYPLAYQQMGLYVQEQFNGIGTSYNMPVTFLINGSLNLDLVEKSFKQIIQDYDVLRTGFFENNGIPVAKVFNDVNWNIESYTANSDDLYNLLLDFVRPFNLEKPPLLRTGVIKLTENKTLLIIDLHHIAVDGISLISIIKKFANLYNGKDLLKPSLDFKDYAVWQQEVFNLGKSTQLYKFWERKLSKELPVLNLPTDFTRPLNRTFNGDCISFNISKEEVINIQNKYNLSGITLNSVFISTFSILLHKYSSQNKFLIGSLVSGRSNYEIEDVIGMFNNLLPIDFSISSNLEILSYIIQSSRNIFDAYENQDYPYSLMVEEFGHKTEKSRNPLFDTMVIFHNQVEGSLDLELNNLQVERLELKSITSKLDLKLDIYPDSDSGFTCKLEYNTSLFKEETISRMAKHFKRILESVVDNPKGKISDIDYALPAEKELILNKFNKPETSFPDDMTIPELFKKSVMNFHDKDAISFSNNSLTYGELDKLSNRLARTLISKGAGRDKIVAVLMNRSIEMPISLFATLKSEGCYLPIDPDYPIDRINYLLKDSNAELLLISKECFKDFSGHLEIDKEKIIEVSECSYSDDSSCLDIKYNPNSLAYVIYTSGSTGKPKGVMIEHKALVNRLNWMQKMYPIGEGDKILQKTPYTFDVSVWEQFWWALHGSSVHFLEPGGEKDPSKIKQVINEQNITTMHFVPSMLNVFLDSCSETFDCNVLNSLKYVFASGEALLPKQVNRFNKLLIENSTKLINLYGPTEATIDVSYFDCSKENEYQLIPIGKPIDNTLLYVVDKDMHLCPVGVPGELCISGIGLARGYLNRPELSSEKFFPNPFSNDSNREEYNLIYKTGDLAKWNSCGDLEYLGRMDFQVKIRGNRVELGEIEVELSKFEKISDVIVVANSLPDGEKYLCAYYVSQEELPVNKIREFLSKKLTEYMIPSYFIRLAEIPLTSNGKANRKLLPEPKGKKINTGAEYLAPQSNTEKMLANIWKEILNIEDVGINDNFFDLGGHSLKASLLVSEIYKHFGIELKIVDIFNQKTIKELEVLLNKSENTLYESIPSVVKSSNYSISSSQKRLFILNKIDNSTTYNLPGAMLINGKIDIQRMELAFKELINRHETLRTYFTIYNGEPVQIVKENVDFNIDFEEHISSDLDTIISDFIKPFNLECAPLFRVKLINVEINKHLMVFDLHHIIADGFSSIIMSKEFIDIYTGVELPRLTTTYKDFSSWQNKCFINEVYIEQERFWLDKFKGDIPILELPTDYKRPYIQSYSGKTYKTKIKTELFKNIQQIVKQNDTTLFMVLFSAYNILLSKYTGQDDITVGCPTAGREHPDVKNIIGMFVNTVAIRNKVKQSDTVYDILNNVKSNSLEAFQHQAYPFEVLIDKLNIEKDLSRNPLFDTMFVLQNMGVLSMETKDLHFETYEIVNNVSKFDITFEAIENPYNIALNIEYNTALFKEETISRMAEHFKRILESVVDNPKGKISDIDYALPAEKELILNRFNKTETSFPDDMTIPELFKKSVIKFHDKDAVSYLNNTLTYGELDKLSNRLARTLISKGAGRDKIVAVLMNRSLEMPISLFATLKSEGCYLPIDPDYPIDRINYLLKDSNAELLLISKECFKDFSGHLEIDKEKIIEVSECCYSDDSSCLDIKYNPNSLAYVIYTSGSTGNPKGVMIEHKALVNRLNWMQKMYPIGEGDKILQKTPYTFDVSVWEQFWWALHGSSVHFLEPGGEKDPSKIKQVINEQNITTMHFVPSMLNVFLDSCSETFDCNVLNSLKYVFASGEALLPKQVNRFNKLFIENSTKLINLYGPTEATIDVSYFDCSKENEYQLIPIGKPIDNTHLYVVDKDMHLCPVGVPGELCISGIGLARGYLNRSELNSEKFVPNPFSNDSNIEEYNLMYKTGDLAKWNSCGDLEYLGRMDFQVKIRGNRVELGEIEVELSKFEKISDVIVVANSLPDGEKYLCAYYVSQEELPVNKIREFLSKKLTEYMIPSYFIRLAEIPLTSNGKANRKLLPEPKGKKINTGAEYLAPQSNTEIMLAKIWKEILNIEDIGINDNFFDMGGNSLLLVGLQSRLLDKLNNNIKITDLFSNPTIYKLGIYIDDISNVYTPNKTKIPLSYLLQGNENLRSGSYYTYSYGENITQKLKLLEGCSNFSEEDIFTALFIHLLQQISGNSSIGTNVVFNNRISSIQINTENVSSLSDLVSVVNKEINLNTIQIKDLKNISKIKGDNEIITQIKFGKSSEYLYNFTKECDLILSINSTFNSTTIDIDFSQKKINGNKIKDLFEHYINFISVALEQTKTLKRSN